MCTDQKSGDSRNLEGEEETKAAFVLKVSAGPTTVRAFSLTTKQPAGKRR